MGFRPLDPRGLSPRRALGRPAGSAFAGLALALRAEPVAQQTSREWPY